MYYRPGCRYKCTTTQGNVTLCNSEVETLDFAAKVRHTERTQEENTLTLPTLTLPTYNAISFTSEAEHKAAIYDACLLIVNTYNRTDMLDFYEHNGVTPYTFMTFARNVLNRIAEEN